jgi:hypothetical protein
MWANLIDNNQLIENNNFSGNLEKRSWVQTSNHVHIFHRVLNLKFVKNLKSANQKKLTANNWVIFAWTILNFWQILRPTFSKVQEG